MEKIAMYETTTLITNSLTSMLAIAMALQCFGAGKSMITLSMQYCMTAMLILARDQTCYCWQCEKA